MGEGAAPGAARPARRHARQGALPCSACSGIFLLAETGLWDGREATVHFGYARAFAAAHPQVRIHPDRVLGVAGRHEELATSGASRRRFQMTEFAARPETASR